MSSKKNPHRKQSWVGCEEGFEVLYDGAKTFWRTRKSLDVLIVSHPAHLCIELITYDAEIGKEAPRLYLNSMMLRTLVDAAKVEEKLGKLKEVCNRQKKDFDRSKASKEFFEELMVEYIVNKLNMGDVEDPETQVKVLVGNEGGLLEDDDADINDQALVRRKPNGLKVVEVNYTKKASAKEILAAQQALLAESRALQRATKMAELMATATDRWAKMLAEKKRISRLSRAKKRWIYAINQVMIANYIQAVKKRLERSEVRDWYLAVMAKAAADEVQRKEQEAEAATAAMREVAQTTQPPPQATAAEATSTSSIKPSRGSARRSKSPPMRRGSFDSTGSSPARGRSRKGTSSKGSPATTGATRGGRSSSEKYSGEKATATSSSTSASSSSSSASSKRAQRRTLDNSDSLPRLNSTTSIKEGKEGVTQLVHVPPPSSSSITAAAAAGGVGGGGGGGGGGSSQQQEEESAEAESQYISTGGGEVVHLPLIDAANSTSDSNTTKDSNGTHTHTLAPPPSSSSRGGGGGGGGSSNNKHNNSSNKNNSRHVRRSLPNLPSEERKKSEPAGFEESDPERGQLELEKTTTTTTTIVPEAFVETVPTAPLTGAPGGAAAGMVAPQRRRARA